MVKSDYVVLEVELKDRKVLKCNEADKHGTLNHSKTYFTGLSKFFGSTEWSKLLEGKALQKYEIFLEKVQ